MGKLSCLDYLSAAIINKGTIPFISILAPVNMPHVVGDWPAITNIFSLTSSVFARFCKPVFIKNALKHVLRHAKPHPFEYEMQLFATVIGFFSQFNGFLDKSGANLLSWSACFLCFVCTYTFFFMPFD